MSFSFVKPASDLTPLKLSQGEFYIRRLTVLKAHLSGKLEVYMKRLGKGERIEREKYANLISDIVLELVTDEEGSIITNPMELAVELSMPDVHLIIAVANGMDADKAQAAFDDLLNGEKPGPARAPSDEDIEYGYEESSANIPEVKNKHVKKS